VAGRLGERGDGIGDDAQVISRANAHAVTPAVCVLLTAGAVSSSARHMVTMKDVAKAAGVSQASVSNAYNRPERLSAAQRQHVLEVAQSLGYPGPHAAGRSLRTGRVGAIGVMVTDALAFALHDPTGIALLQGIAAVGELRDVALTLFPFTGSGGDAGHPLIRDTGGSAARGVVDGFLVWSMPDGHPAVETALLRGQKLVVIDAPLLPGVPFVGIRERDAARDGAAHVLAQGHRRVGILVDRLRPDGIAGVVDAARRRAALDHVARERVAGYLSACRAAGLGPRDVVTVEAGGFSEADFDRGLRTVLEACDATALLVASDEYALWVLAELRRRGVRVPEELSVLGFDGVPQAGREGLTTIEQPLDEKARCATRMLLDSIAGGTPRRRWFPTRLAVRGSTAPPARS
jgi:DNA-binding LacI/PurR family transcriptional regulator